MECKHTYTTSHLASTKSNCTMLCLHTVSTVTEPSPMPRTAQTNTFRAAGPSMGNAVSFCNAVTKFGQPLAQAMDRAVQVACLLKPRLYSVQEAVEEDPSTGIAPVACWREFSVYLLSSWPLLGLFPCRTADQQRTYTFCICSLQATLRGPEYLLSPGHHRT